VFTADDFDERGDPRLIAVLVAEDAGDEAAVQGRGLGIGGNSSSPIASAAAAASISALLRDR
jgi:hypothetical protein